MPTLAPIALFVYERIDHTKKTVEALLANDEAKYSTLYIFSDGANFHNRDKILQLRNYLRSIDGFHEINIIEAEDNYGLARSIISGINFIFDRYEEVIVLEDDVEVSKTFLRYMNASLRQYKYVDNVGHINSWSYFNHCTDQQIFMSKIMNCWGWATWKDQWKIINLSPHYWHKTTSFREKYIYDLCGSGEFWPQVIMNLKGKRKTWAIFWYLSLRRHEKYSISPSISYTKNIGLDGTGQNSKIVNAYYKYKLSEDVITEWPTSDLYNDHYDNMVRKVIINRNSSPIRFIKKCRAILY